MQAAAASFGRVDNEMSGLVYASSRRIKDVCTRVGAPSHPMLATLMGEVALFGKVILGHYVDLPPRVEWFAVAPNGGSRHERSGLCQPEKSER